MSMDGAYPIRRRCRCTMRTLLVSIVGLAMVVVLMEGKGREDSSKVIDSCRNLWMVHRLWMRYWRTFLMSKMGSLWLKKEKSKISAEVNCRSRNHRSSRSDSKLSTILTSVEKVSISKAKVTNYLVKMVRWEA